METIIWLKGSHCRTGKGKMPSVMAAGSPSKGSATILGPGEGCSVPAEEGKAVLHGPGSAEPQTLRAAAPDASFSMGLVWGGEGEGRLGKRTVRMMTVPARACLLLNPI